MTSVAFDPWRCDDKNYRFGSVGEDRRLCLWDFSVGMLHRPRGGAGGAARHGSIASRGTALARAETQGSTETDGGAGSARAFTGPHPVEPRASTAMLPPVLTKVVDADPLAWLEFTEEAIMTSCKSGMFSSAFSLVLFFFFSCSRKRMQYGQAIRGVRTEAGIADYLALTKGTSGLGTDHQTQRRRSVRPRRIEVQARQVLGRKSVGVIGPKRLSKEVVLGEDIRYELQVIIESQAFLIRSHTPSSQPFTCQSLSLASCNSALASESACWTFGKCPIRLQMGGDRWCLTCSTTG